MEKEVLLKKLGERVREIRLEKGMTQKELANSIDKDQQSIQRLEAGNMNPTIYYLREIAVGLHAELKDIVETL